MQKRVRKVGKMSHSEGVSIGGTATRLGTKSRKTREEGANQPVDIKVNQDLRKM